MRVLLPGKETFIVVLLLQAYRRKTLSTRVFC